MEWPSLSNISLWKKHSKQGLKQPERDIFLYLSQIYQIDQLFITTRSFSPPSQSDLRLTTPHVTFAFKWTIASLEALYRSGLRRRWFECVFTSFGCQRQVTCVRERRESQSEVDPLGSTREARAVMRKAEPGRDGSVPKSRSECRNIRIRVSLRNRRGGTMMTTQSSALADSGWGEDNLRTHLQVVFLYEAERPDSLKRACFHC